MAASVGSDGKVRIYPEYAGLCDSGPFFLKHEFGALFDEILRLRVLAGLPKFDEREPAPATK